jgi:carboxypeptidase PM20D1
MKKLIVLLCCAFTPVALAVSQHPAVEHLSRAIQIPTVSHQDRSKIDYPCFDEFLAFMRSTYPKVFATLQVDRVADYSVVMRWPGIQDSLKPVLLDSHYDVVPIEPGTEQDWDQQPFAGVIADGFLWGRGALDDKASVIATLEAMEILLAEGFQPERTLLFSFAHDEEIGGQDGAANIVKYLQSQNVQLEYMIGEGGMILKDNPFVPGKDLAMIGLAEKTYVTLTLKAKGDGGHSSMPVRNNAIVRLAKAVQALHDNPFEAQLQPPVTDLLKTVGREVGGLKGFVMEQQWLTEPLLLKMLSDSPQSNALIRTTTAVTMFDAGIKENVISQQAEAKVNFRLLPGYTEEQLIKAVAKIIDDENVEIHTKRWQKGPPVADINGAGYAAVKGAIKTALPHVLVAPSMLTATTDSPHYIPVAPEIYRFHSFTLPMSHAGSIHGTNERIAVEAVVKSVTVSKALIKAVAMP